MKAYRVSFTVEYELFFHAEEGTSEHELLEMAEVEYEDGTDWVLVSHAIDSIEEMKDE